MITQELPPRPHVRDGWAVQTSDIAEGPCVGDCPAQLTAEAVGHSKPQQELMRDWYEQAAEVERFALDFLERPLHLSSLDAEIFKEARLIL